MLIGALLLVIGTHLCCGYYLLPSPITLNYRGLLNQSKLLIGRKVTCSTTGRFRLLAYKNGDSASRPGSTILIFGATGGVGQLVTKKLAAKGEYKVRVAARDAKRARDTLIDESIEIAEFDLVSDTKTSDDQLSLAMSGVDSVVVSVGTTAFPTTKWIGGNTPQSIDDAAVTRIAKAAANARTVKKIVLVTSIGVERRDEMPFKVLNLFGVIDAKRKGELEVIAAAAQGSFDYVIVRPGRLIGGPYTNYDVATLLKIEGGAENGVLLAKGDSLLGDCKRDACAEAVVQALESDDCRNLSFSVISVNERSLSLQEWKEKLMLLGGAPLKQ